MSEIKYLDYEGLEELVSLLDSRRATDNLAVTLALNQINEDIGNINIGNGTLTITRNDESLGTFTANQSSNATIDIDVPESISDFGNDGVQEILNIIKYGLPDVSELTEELKATLEATHNYAKVSQLADYGKSIAYDSGNKKIQLKNGNTVLSEISAADFLVDGMIEDVKIAKGTGANINKDCLIFDFNTDSGITDIEIPIDSIFNANNYYTKDEIDNAGYLTSHQDISGKANTADLATVATSGSYNDLLNKPTIPSLSGYATETYVNNKFEDVLGVNADGVSALKALTEDSNAATGLLNEIGSKVDKVAGKGLSTEDYTTTEKNKLAGIESGAQAHKAPTSSEITTALGYTPYNATNPNGYTSNTGTVTQVKVGTTEYNPLSGIISLPAYPTTLPASDVYSWAKASSKPSYTLAEVGASISVSAITTNTSSSCSITGSGNAGKTETIIYTNSSGADLTVTVPTTYATPDGAAIELTCPNGGYCEVSYINIGGTIYARGL